MRTQDVGLDEVEDPEVLEWAAKENRITLTHDRSTFPPPAYERVIAGQPMPGVIVVHDRLAVGRAIDELLVVVGCSEAEEWATGSCICRCRPTRPAVSVG